MKDNRILMILGAIALVVIVCLMLRKENYDKTKTVVFNTDNNAPFSMEWKLDSRHKGELTINDNLYRNKNGQISPIVGDGNKEFWGTIYLHIKGDRGQLSINGLKN